MNGRTGLQGHQHGHGCSQEHDVMQHGTPHSQSSRPAPLLSHGLLWENLKKKKKEISSNNIEIRILPFARAWINCGCKRSAAAAWGPLAGSCVLADVYSGSSNAAQPSVKLLTWTLNFTALAVFLSHSFDVTSKAKDQRLWVWWGEVPGS